MSQLHDMENCLMNLLDLCELRWLLFDFHCFSTVYTVYLQDSS